MTVILKAYTREGQPGYSFGVKLRDVFYATDPTVEVGFVQTGPSTDETEILANLDGAIKDYTGKTKNITITAVRNAIAAAEVTTADIGELIPA